MKGKRISVLVLILVILLGLAACTVRSDSVAASPAAGSGPSAAEPTDLLEEHDDESSKEQGGEADLSGFVDDEGED